jgi:hypothetical protein|tara:strand:- start:122 stop:1822 length:1701 start_codon:yes stop_codon:yes gene_type:complete
MAGGLLNLIAVGNQNIILNGNPTKSFFKSKYAKYTNFGLQKYRVDQQGQTNIHLTQNTHVSFKIPRYGDLLIDTYLVITLPNIWSPVYKHVENSTTEYRPYEFQWIKNIGSHLIEEVTFTIGGRTIQKFSGNYLRNAVERDFDNTKKELFNIMTGNVSELNDPANYSNRDNNYPSAFKMDDESINNVEPTILSQTLYIPLNTWFSLLTSMALPLICLQYAELEIHFTLKPIQSLFTIKDILYSEPYNYYNEIPRIQAEQNKDVRYGFHRFIQGPPTRDITKETIYKDQRTNINTDIHLMTTQCFLDTVERTLFANNTQEYLIKEVYEYNFERVNKSSKINLESNGLISNWMWYNQRDDVYKRNEWSNYTNWPYENILPNSLQKLNELNTPNNPIFYKTNDVYQINNTSKNIYITGYEPTIYEQTNKKEIMKDFAIIVDGKYRENSLPSGIYDKIEKYNSTQGNSKHCLYHYNFSLSTDNRKYQPSGAFNTNKFKNVEFEFNNHNNPPLDLENVNFTTICDPETGDVIATSKEPTSIYKYNYNLIVMEERFNVLRFQSGTADLVYSR